MRVVRNTLARRALEGTQFACIQEALVRAVSTWRFPMKTRRCCTLIKDFIKTNDKLVVKALAIDNQLLPASGLNKLADLPTRDQAIALLMSV